jgi:hypothetical protein
MYDASHLACDTYSGREAEVTDLTLESVEERKIRLSCKAVSGGVRKKTSDKTPPLFPRCPPPRYGCTASVCSTRLFGAHPQRLSTIRLDTRERRREEDQAILPGRISSVGESTVSDSKLHNGWPPAARQPGVDHACRERKVHVARGWR